MGSTKGGEYDTRRVSLLGGAVSGLWRHEATGLRYRPRGKNHPIELTSNKFIDQKLQYIHEKPAGGVPLKAGLVDEPWEYRFSSARDYMNNQKGLLEVDRTADAVDMRFTDTFWAEQLGRPSQTAVYI